jgi:chromosome segregation ATPase
VTFWLRPLRHIEALLSLIRQEQAAGFARLERKAETIMATLDDLSAAIDELKQAIATEVQQINQKLDQLGQNANDPNRVQQLVDEIKESTAEVSDIINDDQTQPPNPNPGRGRR